MVGINEWFIDMFSPIADNGIKKVAIVISKEDRNYNAAIDTTTKAIKTTMKVFSVYHDAELWLDENN